MRILWTIICQQIEQPRRKGQISRNIQPAKKKKSIFLTTVKKKETITRSEIKSVKTKQSKKPVPWRQKSRTEGLHQEILPNRQRRTYTYFQTIKKKNKKQKTEKEETLPNSFNEITNTLIPKPDEVTTEKEYCRFFLQAGSLPSEPPGKPISQQNKDCLWKIHS